MITSALHIRPFIPCTADYATLVAIDISAWSGEPVSQEVLQHDDQIWDQQYLRTRLIVEYQGQGIAYAQYSETPWAYQPNKYFLKIMVLPVYQRQGIGSLLYQQITTELVQRGACLFTATTREDQIHAIGFLQRRGFHRVIRELESRLDVTTFDHHRFQPTVERVKESGIRIVSVQELQTIDAEWLRKLWELNWAVVPDMPTSEEFTRETLDDFQEGITSPQLRLDALFVAIDTATGQWIGLSGVHMYLEDRDTLYVGHTGVLRSYRRRGIALALKVSTIVWSQQYGARVIVGENEESNPMYLLNEKLGFRYSHAWLGYEKEV
ncbi:MAG: GNAT family N-acetyltransferase [Chloroflexota bacterium]